MRISGIITVCILFSACLLTGCGKDSYNIPDQRANFEKYFETYKIEYTEQGGVYKQIVRQGPGQQVTVTGDSVYFYYSGYEFNQKIDSLFTTNILADAKKSGFEETFLNFSPKGIRLGDHSIMPGLETGLLGNYQGDTIRLYITSDLAYGDKIVGVVKQGSPVVFKVVIDKIVKPD